MSSFGSSGSSFSVVLDSCILYGYPIRDTLLLAAQEGMYRPMWSRKIWEDVLRHLQDPNERKRPITPAQAAHLLEELERYFPEAFVSGYESLILNMTNDPGDRHVLAVAVHSRAQVIVTFNLDDFPQKALVPYGIAAKHPDDFLTDLYDLDTDVMTRVIIDQAAALTRNRMTTGQLLDKLERTHITRFARAVRTHLDADDGAVQRLR